MTTETRKIRYRLVIKYLDAQQRAFSNVPIDKQFQSDFSRVLKYLRTLDDETIQNLLAAKKSAAPKTRVGKPVQEIANLELPTIKEMLLRTDVTRAELEDVLIHRFGVPKGSMRSLGSIENMKIEILSLVENENAHNVIEKIGNEKLVQKG